MIPPYRQRERKPRKRKLLKPGQPYRSPKHRADVRKRVCAVALSDCVGGIEAHHVKTRGAGGGDEWCVPLCAFHHRRLHDMGRATFSQYYGASLVGIARALAERSVDPEIRKRAENVR